MTRPQALTEAVSANLNWVLQPISENPTKPRKKFLRDGLIGLVRTPLPAVCRMARKLLTPDATFLSDFNRLEENPSGADASEGAVIAIDGIGRPCDGTRARVLVTLPKAVGIELSTFSADVRFDQ